MRMRISLRGIASDNALGARLIENRAQFVLCGGGGREFFAFDREAEGGALSKDGLDDDIPTGELNEASRDGETESGSLGGTAPAFGLGVSFEKPGDFLFCNSPTGVLHFELNVNGSAETVVDFGGFAQEYGAHGEAAPPPLLPGR